MKLDFEKNLSNNIYTVTVKTLDFDEQDLSLFADFGEPTVDLGGDIKNALGTVVLGVLPINNRKIKSQFPYTIHFSAATYPPTTLNPNLPLDLATAWISTIEVRYQAVMDKLRLNNDNFSGIEEINV